MLVHQDPGSPTESQQVSQCWSYDIEISGEFHRQGPFDISRHAHWETDGTPTIKTQEQSSFSIELIDIDSEADKTGNPKPVLLKEPDNLLERSLVLARDARAGYIYRPSDSACGIVVGICSYPRDMEPQGHETAYQHKGTVDSVVCTEAQECGGSARAGSCINTTFGFRETKLWDRMLWSTSGQDSTIRLLSNPESDGPGSSEVPPRACHNDSSDTNVEIRDLVPKHDGTTIITVTHSPKNNCNSGSKNRKVTALGK
ncbi:hypothetical protein AYI70_g12055 [Smittium culicis]|uniref:Uncharacterized protein n=1 Tax=Smittium culicis TaxID=133412 RepID=A0A1R1WZ38_9FUNG|nr:hypothetical protein AYI70_g12055 [Smittium culicis]